MSMGKTYNDSSITQLKGADRIRKRPAAVLGSNGLAGAQHTVLEIIGNATDEKLSGYGDRLDICVLDDGSIKIRDYGRGVPLGWNEKEQAWNWFLVYSEMYAGGKYSDNQGILRDINANNQWGSFKMSDHPYLITVGLNGLGASASQFSSEFFTVTSFRDGKASTMKFEKGCAIWDELHIEDSSQPAGTLIHWKPDIEVFTDVDIPQDWIERLAKVLSYDSGFDVHFEYKGVQKHFEASSLVATMESARKKSISGSLFEHSVDGTGDVCICQSEVVIGPGGRGREFFHNKVEVSGGVHESAVNWALGDFMASRGHEVGLKLQVSDYGDKFSILISSLSNKVSYHGQTKNSLDDGYVQTCLIHNITNVLNGAWSRGVDWVLKAVEGAIENAERRKAVQELSKNLTEISRVTKRGKTSVKFTPSRSYTEGKAAETEYWVLEGDSAGDNFILSRDSYFQCVQKIRGKSLNVLKAPIEKILKNAEIRDMIAALGCGVELGIEGYESFDISRCKVGKVIFCSDADIDGMHIRMLLFLIFYRLFPQMLHEGRVYLAECPLYALVDKSANQYYCYSEEEVKAKKEELGFQYKETKRFKGLGEMQPQELRETIADPATRRLTQVCIQPNDVEIFDVLEALFGRSTGRRKEMIMETMLGSGYSEEMGSISDMLDYIEGLDLGDDLEVEEVVM